MINKLNELMEKFIDGSDEKIAYWYEVAYKECYNILDNFTDNDWKELINSLPSRSNVIKGLLLYCITDAKNIYHNRIILELLKTDDLDLFIKTIRVICSSHYEFPQEINDAIVKKIEFYIPQIDEFDKRVINLFIDKVRKAR